MKGLIYVVLSLNYLIAVPISLESSSNDEGTKGIFDGLAGTTTTISSSVGGLNILPGALNAASNSGPMLILGGFQAIVTKFDPSLVQGLPGLPTIQTGK